MIHQDSKRQASRTQKDSNKGVNQSDRAKGVTQLSLGGIENGSGNTPLSNSGVKPDNPGISSTSGVTFFVPGENREVVAWEGVRKVDVNIDYAGFTVPFTLFQLVIELLRKWWNPHGFQPSKGRCYPLGFYTDCILFEPGISLHWSQDRPEMLVNISGGAAGWLNLSEWAFFIGEVLAIGSKFTRLDPKADDYSRFITPRDVFDWWEAGYMCGFHYGSKNGKPKVNGGKDPGSIESVAIGRRGSAGSGKRYIVYDKFIESNGEKDCIRHEVAFYGHKAQALAEAIAIMPDAKTAGHPMQLAQTVFNYIIGAIDWREGSRNEAKSRRKQIAKWAEFVKGSIPIIPKCPKPVRKEEAWKGTLEHQYGRKIAELDAQDPTGMACRMFLKRVIESGYRRGVPRYGNDVFSIPIAS